MKKTIFALIATLLVAACSQAPVRQEEHSSTMQPSWVMSQPELAGHYSIVASAPVQEFGGDEAQRRVVLLKARQEMAQAIRVHVESTLKIGMTEHNGQVDRSFDREDRISSAVALRLGQGRVIEEWRDPLDNMLYVWYATPNDSLKQ